MFPLVPGALAPSDSNILGSDHSSNVENVGADRCSPPLEESLHANNAEKAKEVVVSKRHITLISTAPTKYAVGYGSVELIADPAWTRLSIRVTC